MEPGYIPAAFVAIGLVIGGYFVGNGFARGRASDRYVEVKGLAEREVTANLALWPLRFSATANDLASAQAQITTYHKQVIAFLERNGIPASATELQNLQVNDSTTMRYGRETPGGPRFVVERR